jgi:hypothetical protein
MGVFVPGVLAILGVIYWKLPWMRSTLRSKPRKFKLRLGLACVLLSAAAAFGALAFTPQNLTTATLFIQLTIAALMLLFVLCQTLAAVLFFSTVAIPSKPETEAEQNRS